MATAAERPRGRGQGRPRRCHRGRRSEHHPAAVHGHRLLPRRDERLQPVEAHPREARRGRQAPGRPQTRCGPRPFPADDRQSGPHRASALLVGGRPPGGRLGGLRPQALLHPAGHRPPHRRHDQAHPALQPEGDLLRLRVERAGVDEDEQPVHREVHSGPAAPRTITRSESCATTASTCSRALRQVRPGLRQARRPRRRPDHAQRAGHGRGLPGHGHQRRPAAEAGPGDQA